MTATMRKPMCVCAGPLPLISKRCDREATDEDGLCDTCREQGHRAPRAPRDTGHPAC